MSLSGNYQKLRRKAMIYNILAKNIRDIGFYVKFPPNIHVSAAILNDLTRLTNAHE